MKRAFFAFAFTFAFALASATPGCIEASQQPLDYEAVAVTRGNGTAVTGGWSITLTRADVALGPFYFCAATSGAATLCESSVAEVTSVTVVNALAPAPVSLGRVHGFSGTIESASYDFGITWLETQREATPAAGLPGGRSMRLEGVARNGAVAIPFTADVEVTPQFQGQNAVATAPARANVQSPATRLEVVLEPAAWLRQVDFDAVAARNAVPLTIVPGTIEHNALLVGIKNLAPLQFQWTAVTTNP
jgi:hypothetical protein